MFLHDFVYVDQPPEVVRERLLAGGFPGLDRAATGAYHDGERLLARVGPFAGPGPTKQVLVEIGDCYPRDDVLVCSFCWAATGPTALFPNLQADLEVAPLGTDRTQISLLGRYQPPLGRFGERLDKVLLHRIAEATVRSFLHRLAEELQGDPAAAA